MSSGTRGHLQLLYGGGPGDPNYAKRVLILHFDGVNGSGGPFTDNSSYAHVAAGTTAGMVLSTSTKKFGSASASLTYTGVGSGDYTNYTHTTEFDVTTGDFAIEGWVNPTSFPGAGVIIAKVTGTGFYPYQVYFDASGKLGFRGFDNVGPTLSYSILDSVALPTATWTYFSAWRSGNVFSLSKAGSLIGTATFAGTLYSAADPTYIGDLGGAAAGVNGFLDDIRLSKGISSSITVPSAPWPNHL